MEKTVTGPRVTHFSAVSSRLYSISLQDVSTLQGASFMTMVGGAALDLVSAPLAPGEYCFDLTAIMGRIEVYLPRYAKLKLYGSNVFSERRIVFGLLGWTHLKERTQGLLALPGDPSAYALEGPKARDVTIQLNIHTVMGGAVLYRLSADGKHDTYHAA